MRDAGHFLHADGDAARVDDREVPGGSELRHLRPSGAARHAQAPQHDVAHVPRLCPPRGGAHRAALQRASGDHRLADRQRGELRDGELPRRKRPRGVPRVPARKIRHAREPEPRDGHGVLEPDVHELGRDPPLTLHAGEFLESAHDARGAPVHFRGGDPLHRPAGGDPEKIQAAGAVHHDERHFRRARQPPPDARAPRLHDVRQLPELCVRPRHVEARAGIAARPRDLVQPHPDAQHLAALRHHGAAVRPRRMEHAHDPAGAEARSAAAVDVPVRRARRGFRQLLPLAHLRVRHGNVLARPFELRQPRQPPPRGAAAHAR